MIDTRLIFLEIWYEIFRRIEREICVSICIKEIPQKLHA